MLIFWEPYRLQRVRCNARFTNLVTRNESKTSQAKIQCAHPAFFAPGFWQIVMILTGNIRSQGMWLTRREKELKPKGRTDQFVLTNELSVLSKLRNDPYRRVGFLKLSSRQCLPPYCARRRNCACQIYDARRNTSYKHSCARIILIPFLFFLKFIFVFLLKTQKLEKLCLTRSLAVGLR